MSNWWRIDPKSWYTPYHPPSIIENVALFYKPIASIIYPYVHVMNMISLTQRLSDLQKFKTKSPQRLPAFPASKASFVAARAAAIATLRGFERRGFLMCFEATEFFLVFLRQCHSRHNAPKWSNHPKYMCQTTVCLCVL